MELMVIEVHGIPDGVPHDRMVNQLTIHFLKRGNSGGDVLTVIYPTSTPCQAYVVFESSKVPGVLEATHLLEVDNRFYPLHVQRACLSEVDMPVETILDLKLFKRQDHVRKLIRDHDFQIYKLGDGLFQLTGSFLKLKLLRSRLMEDLHISLSGHSNGSSLSTQRETHSLDPRITSKPPLDDFDKDRSVPTSYDDLDFASGGPKSLHSLPSFAMRSPPGYSDHLKPSSSQSVQASSSAFSSGSALVYQMEPYSSDNRLLYEATSMRSGTIGGEEHDRASSYGGGSPRNHDSHLSYSTRRNGRFSGRMLASSSALVSGSTLASQRDPRRLETRNASTPMRGYHAGREEAYGQSFSDDRALNPSRLDGDTLGRSSTSSERTASIMVDTDTLDFMLTQRQDRITFINNMYHTKMSMNGDAEVTTVTFSGRYSEKAKECLLAALNDIGPFLRTQEINPKDYPAARWEQICTNIQRYENSDVLIKHKNNVIKLVGSSLKSFDIKQKLLEIDNKPRGGGIERSSSVPRKQKLPDHQCSPEPNTQASTANKLYPSKYGGQAETENASQQARGRPRDKRKVFSQRRTQSEHRTKTEAIGEWESHNPDLPRPSGEMVTTKQQLGPPSVGLQNAAEIRKKLLQHKSGKRL